MDLGITGRTAVISGAAGAIALETARILHKEGCQLILTDRDAEELAESVRSLGGGDDIRSVVADLNSAAGAEQVQKVGVRGHADWQPGILLHAAGVTGAKGDPLDDICEDDWLAAWNTDFMTAVRMAKVFIPPMRRAGWGRVVFVTSENAAQPYPDEAVYNCAKAAVLSFAKALSQVYAKDGVLVNCVAPAFVATDMTDGMMQKRAKERGTDMDEAIESFLAEERPHLVLKRRGKPEEVGFIAACLLSEHASFVTGANYRIDGGAVQAVNI